MGFHTEENNPNILYLRAEAAVSLRPITVIWMQLLFFFSFQKRFIFKETRRTL